MPERATSHDNQQCTPKRGNDRYILKKENMQQQNEILKGKTKVLSADSQKNIKKNRRSKLSDYLFIEENICT